MHNQFQFFQNFLRICTKLRTNSFYKNSIIRQRLILSTVRFNSTDFKGTYDPPKKTVITKPSSSFTSFIEDISSEDNRIAIQDKSTKELFRSLIVYKLCSSQWLVDHAPSLLKLAEKTQLSTLAYWIIRKTFFAHFCGGETAQQCINIELNNHGIGLILSLSIESDINENGEESSDTLNKVADDVTEMMVDCIENAAVQPNSFVALKLTGLSNQTVLHNWTSALNILSNSFDKFDSDKDDKLERSDFFQLIRELFGDNKENVAKTLFDDADKNKDGLINKFEFINALSLDNLYARQLLILNYLKQQDFDDYDKTMNRLKKLCDIARLKNVRLLMDAEQLYFQPAIDNIVIKLSREYNKPNNKNGPIVFNTYQMYLKDSNERLIQNYNLSNIEQFVFAAKLVRGAYMFGERERAEKLGYPDPIHNTLEDTHASYNRGVKFLLNELSQIQKRSNKQLDISNSPIAFMIASHNKETIIKACEQMESLNISSKSGLVLFGQLLGMRDQITYTLGKYGYGIYKYVAYGKIDEVMPFLIRRAQENSSILEGVRGETQILWREIKDRIFHYRLSQLLKIS
ncbi:FAD-linked oxidoreductase-like protein [Glomus cerebriforme]|uniref:Proline dehydrogenase n=1 Tax=Glomus cerebriforme TaxID=658196 RepID=A0A397SG74_9GLOM|nr:FAD-linked oxidoreductase-like protein [Glomus cerebriforme]